MTKPLLEQADLFGNPIEKPSVSPLNDKFVVPPFSVLDARQGYWRDRKAEWSALGVVSQDGRDDNLLQFSDLCNQTQTGTSIFDPVLSEITYKWFAPEGSRVLDPFAGGSTRGIVAAHLGHRYYGIELRQEQIVANEKQAAKIGCQPFWICGDSAKLGELIPDREYEDKFDLIFTCPPYFDLERYSDGKSDGSAFESYEKFMLWYEAIFRQAIKLLKWNRFLVVVVGEIRDEKGFYRNFVGDNISCFLRLGLRYYNEAILVTSIGSLPLRVGRQFGGYRKLGKTHQNVLVFYNGSDHNQINEKFGEMFEDESSKEAQ